MIDRIRPDFLPAGGGASQSSVNCKHYSDITGSNCTKVMPTAPSTSVSLHVAINSGASLRGVSTVIDTDNKGEHDKNNKII